MSLCCTHDVSLGRAAPPRVLSSTGVTPLHRSYDPSDFLSTVSTALPTGLVRRYCTPSQSTQDLPRSPVPFDCMPCSQTPGTPHAAAHYRDLKCRLLGYLNHRPSQNSNLTRLHHFNPKAYGLQSLCLRLTRAVAGAGLRLDTECGGSPLLRRDFHPLGQHAPRGAQIADRISATSMLWPAHGDFLARAGTRRGIGARREATPSLTDGDGFE